MFVSDAIHKAVISVDKEGTEAAAATGMVMMLGSCLYEDPPVIFHVDQPFCFFIFSGEQIPLFAGRLNEPLSI